MTEATLAQKFKEALALAGEGVHLRDMRKRLRMSGTSFAQFTDEQMNCLRTAVGDLRGEHGKNQQRTKGAFSRP